MKTITITIQVPDDATIDVKTSTKESNLKKMYAVGYKDKRMIFGPNPDVSSVLSYIPSENEEFEGSLYVFQLQDNENIAMYKWSNRRQKWVNIS